jgi:hypothetical protein
MAWGGRTQSVEKAFDFPIPIVRIAAHGIVERVTLLCPGSVDHLLKRARPPYEPRGSHWPELDVDEARAYSSVGSKIVWGDLSWYVADHCFSPFLMEKREYPVEQEEDLLASVDNISLMLFWQVGSLCPKK